MLRVFSLCKTKKLFILFLKKGAKFKKKQGKKMKKNEKKGNMTGMKKTE